MFPFRRGQYASHKKAIEKHLEDMFDGPGPPGAAKRPQRPPRNQICTALLYGRAGRLTALLGRCPARADMLADEGRCGVVRVAKPRTVDLRATEEMNDRLSRYRTSEKRWVGLQSRTFAGLLTRTQSLVTCRTRKKKTTRQCSVVQIVGPSTRPTHDKS